MEQNKQVIFSAWLKLVLGNQPAYLQLGFSNYINGPPNYKGTYGTKLHRYLSKSVSINWLRPSLKIGDWEWYGWQIGVGSASLFEQRQNFLHIRFKACPVSWCSFSLNLSWIDSMVMMQMWWVLERVYIVASFVLASWKNDVYSSFNKSQSRSNYLIIVSVWSSTTRFHFICSQNLSVACSSVKIPL